MNLEDIKILIAKDENRVLELKKSTGELNKGMETACAFLNSDGGWLLFGISPSLKIIGQNITDSTKQEIANALRKIEPAIDVEVEYIELPDKPNFYVVAIYFDANNFKNGPYSFDGRSFYKLESTTAQMPRQMYEERLKLSNPSRFSWENTPNSELKVQDIDSELLFQTMHDGIGSRRIHASAMTLHNPEQIMLKLGVCRKDGLILNAANVLFGKDPTFLHSQCKIRLARFEGTDKRVFRDQTVCEGNLFEQYDAVIDFCLKHLNLSGRMDSKFRQDVLTVPYEAIKEATINMLCHRSWSTENLTPSVAIYDDRIVFQNPGSFPHGMKWQDFANNQIGSIPANPTIANVFYRRGTMEAWGRGIGLILQSCIDQDLPTPEISVVYPFVNLTIWFKNSLKKTVNTKDSKYSSFLKETYTQCRVESSPPVEDNFTPSNSEAHPQSEIVSPPVGDNFTPSNSEAHPQSEIVSPQDKILEFCITPRSITEISALLGVNDKKWVRKKYIAPLIGVKLELTIPDKPNSRKQQYRTIKK